MPSSPHSIDLDQLRTAHKKIAPYLHHTPLITSRLLSEKVGFELRFKAENFQKSGSFKARGAHWKALQLATQASGLITFSSGNHGQAVALAAHTFGLDSIICVPETVSPVKEAAMRDYGARVEHAGTTSTQRRQKAESLAASEGFTIVPPFDDADIIAGQGTAALEILDDWPAVERIVVPVGGGGLLAGTILAIRELKPEIEIVAVEAVGAPTLRRALEANGPIDLDGIDTIADGLAPLRIGSLNYQIVAEFGVQSVLVPDSRIREALGLLLTRTKLFVEPSAAASFAAILEHDMDPKPTAIILSGGNVSLPDLARILEEK